MILTKSEMNRIIRKAEMFFGDIMGEMASQEYGEEGPEGLCSGVIELNKDEIECCMFDSLEQTMVGWEDYRREIVDYWYEQEYGSINMDHGMFPGDLGSWVK